MTSPWSTIIRAAGPSAVRAASIAAAFALCLSVAAGVERMTVRELVTSKADLAKYAREKTVLQISGRYEGRFSKQFRMHKLPFTITPARTTVLPADLDAGQRISATGIIRKTGSRYVMEATRIVITNTDLDRVLSAVRRIGDDKPEEIYALAKQYTPVADFYQDETLTRELDTMRSAAFRRQRADSAGDAAGLQALAGRGKSLRISESVLAAVRFESLVAESKSENAVPAKLLQKIIESFPGWDNAKPLSDDIEAAFLKAPVETYNTASAEIRPLLHRRFYRVIKLPELQKLVRDDGRNALDVAKQVATELPEETEEIGRLRRSYIDYRLARVPGLTRQQLGDLETLLMEYGREKAFHRAVDEWVKAQEKRLNNGAVDGIQAAAEEYLFAFERWKNPQHLARGTELLKQVWTVINDAAPREAKQVENRLEQLGWFRIRDRWMSSEQIDNLPENDVELAIREGRVVPGMNMQHVLGIHGAPEKRIRLVSAKYIQEIWVIGEAGSTAITIYMKRLRRESPDKAVVTLVAKSVESN